MNTNVNFTLNAYPFRDGSIMGHFRNTSKTDAKEYLDKQDIRIYNPYGKDIIYPNHCSLVEKNDLLILVCHCGIIDAFWRSSKPFQISMEKALEEYVHMVSR